MGEWRLIRRGNCKIKHIGIYIGCFMLFYEVQLTYNNCTYLKHEHLLSFYDCQIISTLNTVSVYVNATSFFMSLTKISSIILTINSVLQKGP